MGTVTEIEHALRKLPVKQARQVADWLQRHLDERWDRQIDEDIAAGRLDKIAERSLRDYEAGRVKPLDEVIDEPIGNHDGYERLLNASSQPPALSRPLTPPPA